MVARSKPGRAALWGPQQIATWSQPLEALEALRVEQGEDIEDMAEQLTADLGRSRQYWQRKLGGE